MKKIKNSLILIITLLIITKVYTQDTITTTLKPFQYNPSQYKQLILSNTLFGIQIKTHITHQWGQVRLLDDTERIVRFVTYLFPKNPKKLHDFPQSPTLL